jgi:hypothetical protein
MLATSILDSFTKDEPAVIASALDELCSPDDSYGFASACIYAFWSLPGQDLLYVGLARDVARRFRQHTGLLDCDPADCKRRQIEQYFQTNQRLGYSIIVQSRLDQPVSNSARRELAELYDEEFAADVAGFIAGEENIIAAEGFVLELHRRLGDRLPPWNKKHGSELGQRQRSLFPDGGVLRTMEQLIRTGRMPDQGEGQGEDAGLPYDLLLNITGYELSDLNAKSTLRQLASDAVAEGHEEFLHGVRMFMVSRGMSFHDGLQVQLGRNPVARQRVEVLRADGYLRRTLAIPGLVTGPWQQP